MTDKKKNIKFMLALFLSFISNCMLSQKISLSDLSSQKEYENIFNQTLFQDSADVSSFLIHIKKEVKTHKHLDHVEHVLVLEGEGKMILDKEEFVVRPGDLIFIPKNTFHSVKTTSTIPLKVVSFQAPFFDGKDRVLKSDY